MPFDPDAFRSAAASSNDEAPPDAHYDAELIDSTIVTANADGRQWLKLTWKVLAGAQRDESWASLHTIDAYKQDGETNPGLGYTIDSLRKMGVTRVDEPRDSPLAINDDDDLRAAVREFHGRGFDVEVKRSGRFVNTYPSHPLDVVAPSLPGTGGGGGAARPSGNAIYGSDGPAQQSQATLSEQAQQSREPVHVGGSDVTPEGAADELRQPYKKGDVNPDTGEPFQF